MSDPITLFGRVASEPKRSDRGADVTSFRLACTERRRDARTGEYADAGTNWYDVEAWRGLGRNAAESLRKGDPVVVQGSLEIDDWQRGEQRGRSVRVTARHLGPDLLFGTARFASSGRAAPAERPAPATAPEAEDEWARPGADDETPF